MAENEANEIKDKKGYRLKLVILWIGMIIGIIVIIFFLYLAWKNDNSEDKTLVNYIGIGISVEVAVISGMYSLISNHITKNEIYREKQESQISEKEFRKEQEKREDDLREKQKNREDYLIKKQKEFEEKWNQKKIDADLKARARIEWIQRVREATSKFITACYCFIRLGDKYNKEEMKMLFRDVQETGLLLILYFGPDESGDNQEIARNVNNILRKIEVLVEAEDIQRKFKKVAVLNDDEYKLISKSLGDDAEKIVNNFKDAMDKVESELKALNRNIRRYLKEEWKKARDNK